jgi:phytoene desaturase
MPEKVAVIGSGIGGLAVAIRLAAKGYRVTVYEKNDGPGGKMSEIRHEGYRFDTGPSLFTLPHLIRELYDAAGEDISRHFQYKKLDEVCRYFFPDGMTIRAHSDPEKFAGELQEKAGEDPEKVLTYLAISRDIYEMTEPVFIRRSLHKIRNYLTRDFSSATLKIHKLKPFSTLHQVNSRYFSHPNTVQLFDRFATYNGSSPYKTPATLMVIPHLEHNIGAFFPEKGMFDIARSLVALGERLGVSYRFGSEVNEVVVNGLRVTGLRVTGDRVAGKRVTGERENEDEVLDYDLVVSDLDIWYLYKNLLKPDPFPQKWFRHERSNSALIFYWGMETVSPQLALHNILFTEDYRQEFNCLFNMKTLHNDPTIYIFVSSKEVTSDAPEGCENWFVMVNAPENTGQDWERMIADCRLSIVDKIKRFTGIDVEKHRKFEFVLDPRGIETKTASYRGSLYGNSSNSLFAAFQRHPNFSRYKGLYFTGGSVHPGGGIPLCLSSASIVSDLIIKR